MQDPEARIAPFAVRGTQAITSVEGLVVQGASKALPKVGAIADKYPLLSELFVSTSINSGYQGYKMLKYGDKYDPYSLVENLVSTGTTRNMGYGNQLRTNLLIGTASYEMQGRDNELPSKWGETIVSTTGGYVTGKALSKTPLGNASKTIIGAGASEFLGDFNSSFGNEDKNENKK